LDPPGRRHIGGMSQSFTPQESLARDSARKRRRVLVTGAAGHIGSYFAEHSRHRYDLRLMVRPNEDAADVDRIRDFGEIVPAELSDLDRMKQICQGIDTVLHLAANPSPSATWDSVLNDNLTGTYHTFVAAKAAP